MYTVLEVAATNPSAFLAKIDQGKRTLQIPQIPIIKRAGQCCMFCSRKSIFRASPNCNNCSSMEESSTSSMFCDICMDTKPAEEMFRNSDTCPHLFCKECISNYVAAKVEENISVIECPDLKCKGVIGPEICRSIVPTEVVERWEINLICQSLIPESEKFYCPYKDCSALLVDDGGEVVTASECPICRRLFCAQCKVSWHSGMECEEFQSLTKEEREREDLLLIELANGNKWRRCPSCRIYVERKEGCLHITCRCGFAFCYGCGAGEHSSHDCPHTRGS